MRFERPLLALLACTDSLISAEQSLATDFLNPSVGIAVRSLGKLAMIAKTWHLPATTLQNTASWVKQDKRMIEDDG